MTDKEKKAENLGDDFNWWKSKKMQNFAKSASKIVWHDGGLGKNQTLIIIIKNNTTSRPI